MPKLAAVEAQALKLDSRSRAKLVERLILSLDGASEAEIEKLWIQEAERRVQEIREGRVVLQPASVVLRRALREFSRKRSGSTR
jgi:putative addiction module component